MTQEDKELLLQDLSARLPYGVKCQTKNGIGTLISVECSFGENLVYIDFDRSEAEEYDLNDGNTVKPYLRHLCSMTDEEKEEQSKIVMQSMSCSLDNSESATTMVNDWLLSKHFDVRGLIPKGLALEAPESMYKHFGDMDVVVTSVEHKDKL